MKQLLWVFGLVLCCTTISLSGCITVPQAEHKADIDRAVSSHIKLAYKYLRADQPNEAKRHLSQARALRPKSEVVHNALAIFYDYLHNPEKEEEHLKKALKYNPNYPAARNNYGLLLSGEGRYEEAVEQFYIAAHDLDNPNSGLAYANLGRCYQAMGNNEKAMKAYRKAERLHSAGPSIFLAMAELYFADQDNKDAQRYYDNYVAFTPTQSAAALWLGIRLSDRLENMSKKAHYETMLEEQYPDSEQYNKWLQWNQKKGEQ